MCGRARLSSDVSEIKIAFGIPPERPTPNFPPSWNVAPTDTLPVVRYDTKAGQRSLDMLRCWSFGLKRTIGRESIGATFQLGGKFGVGRSGGIRKTSLISLTSEDRRARPHMAPS